MEVELGLVAFFAVPSTVPGCGMILNGPIFFKTSDLNSMVSYDFGISLSLSRCICEMYNFNLSLQKYKSFQVYFSRKTLLFFQFKTR